VRTDVAFDAIRVQVVEFIRKTFHMITFINFPDNVGGCELRTMLRAVPDEDIREHLQRHSSFIHTYLMQHLLRKKLHFAKDILVSVHVCEKQLHIDYKIVERDVLFNSTE
jgi:hypothetical protein